MGKLRPTNVPKGDWLASFERVSHWGSSPAEKLSNEGQIDSIARPWENVACGLLVSLGLVGDQSQNAFSPFMPLRALQTI